MRASERELSRAALREVVVRRDDVELVLTAHWLGGIQQMLGAEKPAAPEVPRVEEQPTLELDEELQAAFDAAFPSEKDS